MADEVSGNIVAELRKRGTFGGFSEERMHLVLEGMWDKVEYDLNDAQKWQVNQKSVMIKMECKMC